MPFLLPWIYDTVSRLRTRGLSIPPRSRGADQCGVFAGAILGSKWPIYTLTGVNSRYNRYNVEAQRVCPLHLPLQTVHDPLQTGVEARRTALAAGDFEGRVVGTPAPVRIWRGANILSSDIEFIGNILEG